VIRLTLPSLLVPRSHDILIARQATDSNRVRELKMSPADQIQRLDSGQRANKDPLDPASDSHWTVTANTAVKCWRSLSRKANHHQLSMHLTTTTTRYFTHRTLPFPGSPVVDEKRMRVVEDFSRLGTLL